MHHGAHNALYSPPLNFAMVVKDVYRSAYPTEANIPYLRNIGIKTLVLLSIESLAAKVLRALEDPPKSHAEQNRYPLGSSLHSLSNSGMLLPMGSKGTEMANALLSRGIRVLRLANLRSWRHDAFNSGDDFSQWDVMRGLDIAVDARWHPVLFSCPTGELQTNVLVGCLRRYQNWSLTAIFNECELFTSLAPTTSSHVLNFISMWFPEEHPINELDVAARNREWFRQSGAKPQARDPREKSLTDAIHSNSKTQRVHPQVTDDNDDSYDPNVEELSSNSMFPQEHSILSLNNANNHLLLPNNSTSGKASSHTSGVEQIDQFRFAEWYLQTLISYSVLGEVPTQENEQMLLTSPEKSAFDKQLPPPHVRYAGVRNPPSLDPRSTFTKESIVEEDDD